MTEVEKRFERDLATVCWRELRVHLQRDAIVTVDPDLDIITAATAVAHDETERVAGWIDNQLLGKPTAPQLQQWEGDLDREFKMLIVQPYIFVQDVADHG